MTQEVRTYFADSVHAIRKSGLLQIPLVEGIEVPAEGLCAYIDDVTLAGQLSAVNAHNQRLYVVEKSPFDFDFTGTVSAFGDSLDESTDIVIQKMPSNLVQNSPFAQYLYMANLPVTQVGTEARSLFFSRTGDEAVFANPPVDPARPRASFFCGTVFPHPVEASLCSLMSLL